jgi:hypothetical protein
VKQVFVGQRPAPTSTTGARYNALTCHSPTGWETSLGIVAACQPWSVDGVFRNLVISLTPAPGVGKSWTFTVMVNGVATALSVTISDAEVTGRDTVNEITVAPGDYLTLQAVPSGTPAGITGSNFWVSCEFEGSTARESGCSIGAALTSTSAVRYRGPGDAGAWNATRTTVENIWAVDGVIDRLDVRTRTAPGAGKSYTLVLYKNGVAQDGTGGTPDTRCVLADTATTAYSTFSLPVTGGDALAIECTPANSPTNAYLGCAIKVTATIDGESQMSSAITGNLDATATRYHVAVGADSRAWGLTESFFSTPAGVSAFRVGKFRVRLSAAPGAGKSYTLSLRRNSDSPAGTPSVTVADAATTGSDLVGALTVSDGDVWAMRSAPATSPAAAFAQWGLVQSPAGPPTPVLTATALSHHEEHTMWLQQSTSVSVKLGPFLDDSDGKTAETALTIQKADVLLSKNGGALTAASADQGVADAGAPHDAQGYYTISLNATDTGTLGRLKVVITKAGALPVWQNFMVLAESTIGRETAYTFVA